MVDVSALQIIRKKEILAEKEATGINWAGRQGKASGPRAALHHPQGLCACLDSACNISDTPFRSACPLTWRFPSRTHLRPLSEFGEKNVGERAWLPRGLSQEDIGDRGLVTRRTEDNAL